MAKINKIYTLLNYETFTYTLNSIKKILFRKTRIVTYIIFETKEIQYLDYWLLN